MSLPAIKTPSGKTIADFTIPEVLLSNDTALVTLIIKSESMNDEERQYWFNLTEVMNTEQVEKLRDILIRERDKLAEIEAKYAKKREDPAVAQRRAEDLGKRRAAEQAKIKAQEAKHEAKEAAEEAAILAELENL